jgi:hypothetical protein
MRQGGVSAFEEDDRYEERSKSACCNFPVHAICQPWRDTSQERMISDDALRP